MKLNSPRHNPHTKARERPRAKKGSRRPPRGKSPRAAPGIARGPARPISQLPTPLGDARPNEERDIFPSTGAADHAPRGIYFISPRNFQRKERRAEENTFFFLDGSVATAELFHPGRAARYSINYPWARFDEVTAEGEKSGGLGDVCV